MSTATGSRSCRSAAPSRCTAAIRSPSGSVTRKAASSACFPRTPRLTFFYRDPAARTFLQIQGRGRVDDDPHVRGVVFDNSPEREQAIDPQRLGVAVVVDVDRVQGRLPDGAVNMRSADPDDDV